MVFEKDDPVFKNRNLDPTVDKKLQAKAIASILGNLFDPNNPEDLVAKMAQRFAQELQQMCANSTNK